MRGCFGQARGKYPPRSAGLSQAENPAQASKPLLLSTAAGRGAKRKIGPLTKSDLSMFPISPAAALTGEAAGWRIRLLSRGKH
jgi:hypothetical protein